MKPAITIGAFAFALAALPLSAAVSSARAEARAAHGRTRQADEATQRIEPELSALVAKRDKFVAEQRDKAPPKASSFDRVVEDTLKA